MNSTTRRSFLKTTAMVGGALALRPTSTFAQPTGANGDIRVAVVGFNGKGKTHIAAFSSMPGVRLVALCDADSTVLGREVERLGKKNTKVQGFTDVRKLLESKEIDAIATATPNHWHALITVWACQAGKDVYVEKPVSHDIWEGRKAVEAARKYKRIVQAGTQSRSDQALREAFAYLQAGNLGKMRLARGFCYKRRDSIGKVDGPQPIPEGIDYDLWCGPAPKTPLMRKKLHYDWHWVWPTGNGDIGNQGIHEMDMCRWVIQQDGLPSRVMSIGGRFGYVDDGETPNTQIAFYDYKPVPIIFEVRGLPMAKGEDGADNYKQIHVGLVVECENGYFAGQAAGGTMYDWKGNKLKIFNGPGGKDHQANFIKAVRSRKESDLNADIEKGHISSALCHLGNMSHRIGSKTSPSEIKERIQGDKDAVEALDRFNAHLKANEVDLAKDSATLGPWLTVDSKAERLTGEFSDKGNQLLKREYREPYVIRDQV